MLSFDNYSPRKAAAATTDGDADPILSSYSPSHSPRRDTRSSSLSQKQGLLHSRHCDSSSMRLTESMDFEEIESVMWRKHQLRRFFQDRGYWWTNARRTTARKWSLVVLTGVLVGAIGYFVSFITNLLYEFKFGELDRLLTGDEWTAAFFSFTSISIFYALVAGALCWIEPVAAGSGIPEVKAYLNGVNLNKVVRIRVLLAKVIGMCFSAAAGLPLGKEGPMIHAGAVVGAAVSQGKTITFGFDTSWTKFQDLRNDRSKRDFVTFGAAAGVAAAFSAPIGGILFTLEEGASFWSTTLTFRAFFCAMMTQLTLNLLYSGFQLGLDRGDGLFAFGLFDDFRGFSTFELCNFVLMGMAGGMMGAFFNDISRRANIYRQQHLQQQWKRMLELLAITAVMSLLSFVLPLMWNTCTRIPTDTADWTSQQVSLLDQLVQFQCSDGEYNQVASLYLVPSDTAMQQLYHFREVDGSSYTSFTTGALLLFFVPYFFLAAIVPGILCPAGLFVPTLLAGAAFGRIVGHILNIAFAGYVTDSGTYALVGAAALMGGMSRMTIAGTIILLEASGNNEFLLPLMLTFAAARYTGNAINDPIYDMMIRLQQLPFLEGTLRTLGLLNYHPTVEVMAQPVVTLLEVNNVGAVYRLLLNKTHNGFPVVGKDGHLRGLILRKTLCNLLKLKAFSAPLATTAKTTAVATGTPMRATTATASSNTAATSVTSGDAAVAIEAEIQLAPAATVFHDTLERNYPHYPKIDEIQLSSREMDCWLDIRPYMDTAPYTINASASVERCYRFFRTMGLRHLVVLDGDHRVCGIITRKDVTEHRLEHHWFHEGDNMQKFINLSPVETTGFQARSSSEPNFHNTSDGGNDDDNDDDDYDDGSSGTAGAAVPTAATRTGIWGPRSTTNPFENDSEVHSPLQQQQQQQQQQQHSPMSQHNSIGSNSTVHSTRRQR